MNHVIEKDISEIIKSQLIDWSRFKGKTVLITGANGMIASYLVRTLIGLNRYVNNIKDNVHVLALVRNSEKAKTKFADIIDDPSLELMIQDVNMPIKYDKPIHFIIHAASQASPKYFLSDPIGTIDANVLGTRNTLSFAKLKAVESYLFISSAEVYGEIDSDKFPFLEKDYGYIDLLAPRNCYAESKRMGEQYCVAFHQQYGVPSKIARVFHTYAPGVELDDGRIFGDFVAAVINNEDIILHSDGSAIRLFCYITDAVIAYLKILLDGESGKAYNVANTHCAISVRDLANLVAELSPSKKTTVSVCNTPNSIPHSEVKIAIPDCKAIHSLGWEPTVNLRNGFSRLIEYYS